MPLKGSVVAKEWAPVYMGKISCKGLMKRTFLDWMDGGWELVFV